MSTQKKDDAFYHSLVQGSDEWKTARKDFVLTASELGALMNLNEDGRNNKRLYEEKKSGEEPKHSDYAKNVILQWGIDHEGVAIDKFEAWLKTYEPGAATIRTGIHPKTLKDGISFGASPDRLVVDHTNTIYNIPLLKYIVEVKCPWNKKLYWPGLAETLRIVKAQNGILPLEYFPTEGCNIRIPYKYYVQIQGQLAATRCAYAFFVGWTPTEFLVLRVKFSPEVWYSNIEPAIQRFGLMLQTEGSSYTEPSLRTERGRAAKRALEVLIDGEQDKNNKLLYYECIKRLDVWE